MRALALLLLAGCVAPVPTACPSDDWQSLCEVPSPDAGWGLRPVKGMCRPLPGNPGAWWCCGPEVDGG